MFPQGTVPLPDRNISILPQSNQVHNPWDSREGLDL